MIRNINFNKTKNCFSLLKLNLGRFSEKSSMEKNLENFSLKFDKNVSFEDFKNQMDTNIEIGLNSELKDITNTKLLEILKEKGLEKTQEELEVLSQILAEKGKGTVS